MQQQFLVRRLTKWDSKRRMVIGSVMEEVQVMSIQISQFNKLIQIAGRAGIIGLIIIVAEMFSVIITCSHYSLQLR
jgi:hypothetical protein